MEKRVDVLGTTAKLQINEDNCGGFGCFCTTTSCASATGLNFLEPAPADVSGLVWIGLETAREGFRSSKDKLFYTPCESSLAGGHECAARGESDPHVHVQPACTYRSAGSDSNTHLHACVWNMHVSACIFRAGPATNQHLQRAHRYRKRLAFSKQTPKYM